MKWSSVPLAASERSVDVSLLKFVCKEQALVLYSKWIPARSSGPVRHVIRIVNKGNADLEIPLQQSLSITIKPPSGHKLQNWWVEKGGETPLEIGTHIEPIGPGYTFARKSTPYSENQPRDMIPWINIHDASASAGVYIGVAFSGRVLMKADAVANGVLTLTAGLDPSGGEYRAKLVPGGSYTTPAVFIGCYEGSVDDGVNQLHRWVEKEVRPPVRDKRYPLVVNNSWGSGMAVDEALAKRMIDASAIAGVELFHIDAGWFKGVGDWYPNTEKFPDGLAPIANYAHGKRLKFGLWTGWTQGGNTVRDTQTLAGMNPIQSDWFPSDIPADYHPAEFIGTPVCLASVGARGWCLNELRRMVRDYKLDLLEHDQVMIVQSCQRTDHGHTSHPSDVSLNAANGYYAVYDALRRENPNLLFEDCVNGGRMEDFGVARRVHYISITDTYDPISNRRAFYDTSYPLPPSMCECYVCQIPVHSEDDFKYMIRSGMMGWFTLMLDTSRWTPRELQVARRQISVYKSWIRPLINQGNLYHITERPDGVRWDGMQYFDGRTGKGVVFAFRGKRDAKGHVFKLKGLRSDRTYRVWCEDASNPARIMSGGQLMSSGLDMSLENPESSEIIYLQQK